MSSLKNTEILKSLLKKGFQESKNKSVDHKYVNLIHNGKIQSIYTKVSHGSKDISDPLISAMAKQVKLNKSQFIKYVECSISEQQYKDILHENGIQLN